MQINGGEGCSYATNVDCAAHNLADHQYMRNWTGGTVCASIMMMEKDYVPFTMTKDEYYQLNYESCKKLKEKFGGDRDVSVRIK